MKNEDIKKAFESLTPSDDAKERMLKAIMAKSAVTPDIKTARAKSTPWYIRLKVPIGVCTAAMTCAAAFAVTLLNPGLLNNNKTDNFVEIQHSCENAETSTNAVATEPVTQPVKSDLNIKKGGDMAALTSIPLDFAEKGVQMTAASTTKHITSQKPNEALTTTVTKATNVTSNSVKTTECSTSNTTVTTVTEQTETSGGSTPSGGSLYGDPFDFRSLTWAGINYSTDYTEVSYDNINGFLGSGAAMNYETNKVYTVLIYELENVPVEKGFAVQYIGYSNYYIFYSD